MGPKFRFLNLRVCPETCRLIAKPSDHEADGGEFEEGECPCIEALPVLGEAAAAAKPREGALDERLYNVAWNWSVFLVILGGLGRRAGEPGR
jgi:hypothetical protein